jgi:hypothetical protein
MLQKVWMASPGDIEFRDENEKAKNKQKAATAEPL